MDINAVKNGLKAFIIGHKTQFSELASQQTKLLEMGALALSAEHYRIEGYKVEPYNLIRDSFRVKLNSRGHPWNFSWFRCKDYRSEYTIHANLSVFSNYRQDSGKYVVDVAVVQAGSVPDTEPRNSWSAVENEELCTFLEAKKLVVYPMLIAQFIGIVHEIKPCFLGERRPYGFRKSNHFDPALVAIGYLHATARRIESSFDERNFKIQVVPAFDTEVARLRGGSLSESPLSTY